MYLILLLTKVCFSKRKNITIVIDSEKLPEILTNLGDNLLKEIATPVDEKGEYLMRDLYDYFNNLDDLMDLLTAENGTRKEEGKKVYKIISDKGGPPHLKTEIDFDKLVSKYSWSEDQKRHAIETVKDTRFLWKVVRDHVEPKKKKSDEIFK